MLRAIRIDMRLTQQAILNFLRDNREASIDEIARAVDCHRNTVHYNLKQLRAAGLVKCNWAGGRNKTIYQVTHDQNGHSAITT